MRKAQSSMNSFLIMGLISLLYPIGTLTFQTRISSGWTFIRFDNGTLKDFALDTVNLSTPLVSSWAQQAGIQSRTCRLSRYQGTQVNEKRLSKVACAAMCSLSSTDDNAADGSNRSICLAYTFCERADPCVAAGQRCIKLVVPESEVMNFYPRQSNESGDAENVTVRPADRCKTYVRAGINVVVLSEELQDVTDDAAFITGSETVHIAAESTTTSVGTSATLILVSPVVIPDHTSTMDGSGTTASNVFAETAASDALLASSSPSPMMSTAAG
jgi:hypothetical protein